MPVAEADRGRRRVGCAQLRNRRHEIVHLLVDCHAGFPSLRSPLRRLLGMPFQLPFLGNSSFYLHLALWLLLLTRRRPVVILLPPSLGGVGLPRKLEGRWKLVLIDKVLKPALVALQLHPAAFHQALKLVHSARSELLMRRNHPCMLYDIRILKSHSF